MHKVLHYRGFVMRFKYYGAEVTGAPKEFGGIPEELRFVYANDRRAKDAIDTFLSNRDTNSKPATSRISE